MRAPVALLLPFVLGCGAASQTDVIDVNPAGVSTQTRIDLGALQPATSLTHVVRVRNSSNTDAHLTGFRTSCECATIVPSHLSVKAGSDELCELIVDMRNEPNFTGQLGIEVDGYDESAKTILRLLALLDVRPANPGISDVPEK